MKIGGFLKTSYSDYPGELSSVIFTSACNFKCAYCHNGDLATGRSQEVFDENSIMTVLNSRRQHIGAVVVSGGEPTIQDDLVAFIKGIKEAGFKVKLDTNGSNPSVVKTLIESRWIDFLAMDLKCRIEDYDKITGFKDVEVIRETIRMIICSGIPHEFRTTVLAPYHNVSVLEDMLAEIEGGQKWYLQQYHYTENQLVNTHFETYTREMLEKFKKQLDSCQSAARPIGMCDIQIRAKR